MNLEDLKLSSSFESEAVFVGKYFPKCIHAVDVRQPRHVTVCFEITRLFPRWIWTNFFYP